ncbi:uncharacterized protein LOC119483053 [Sebastes umbrosus]|uniref:uncharacterized protein LOC119483053 n=1 Tax=Sebastes umbrosus TaxID=72105 RepID=UPI00189DBA43|nr:uncharacterized protein LOC119483053 [Sebastes umbrosus]
MGHIICNQGPIEGHHTAKPTLLPSVSHPPLTENYNDAPRVDSTLKTIQSPPPSNKISSTQLFPDVSPNSCLTAERLSTIQHSETIQHLFSVLNQDVMSLLDVTTQSASSTSITGQLTLSGQTELESSLSTSLFEPSAMTFTPALPSETPKIINPVFTVESPKASSSTIPLLQTFFTFLLPDIGVSSLQDNLESPPVTDLQSTSGTELCFNLTPLMQTLSSDFSLMSPQPTSWALHMSLLLTETLSVPLSMIKPSKEQPSIKSAHEQFMPSVQQTLHTLLFGEFYHISLVTGMTASMDLNTAAGPVPVSEDHFDPTAPSTVQEPYTTSFIHQLQDLDPSFPSCGQSVMLDHVYINGCTPQIKSTYIENTVEHFLDSYSQDEEHWTFFPSQSSGQFFSTQTSRNYLSTHPLPSEDVLREQAESNEFTSLLLVSMMHLSATTEINHLTATLKRDISDTLPALEGTGFSQITSAFSGNCVSSENSLLICQPSATDSSGLITLQTLSTSLSRFYEISTALLTSLQAVGLSSYRRESSVQPTPSSASISSSMNLPPEVLQSIPVLMATVGFPFHFSIPPKTFQDPEDGDADALSLEIRLIDGPPLSVGTWLALDGLELHGVPLEVDLQFAPQHLLLAARDGQGLSTRLPLTLDLRRSPVDPCHVFTLTAQRSLHSVLRHRRRVELLLRKLSRFFNSSSSRHLSVVSMRPGSTVVSWYNYSLCGMAHSRVTLCRVDRIQSMWLAMRSADGSVSPAFREAMLPEFPITKVGPVSYRRDCFSTTTPLFDGSTPAVHTTLTPGLATNASLSLPSNTCVSTPPAITATSQQITHYQRMAGMITALLVVCLLILIVLLVAAVLHFCKGRWRSRTVAIWPASRVLSVRSRDLRAIRPRRPPLFQPELPPPPLRLWINLSQGDEGRVPSAREQGRKTVDKALQPRRPQYDFSSIKK